MQTTGSEVVSAEPSIREQSRVQQSTNVRKLQRFRKELEHEIEPEMWYEQELSAGLLLADICTFIGLSEDQRRHVLGEAGAAFCEDLQNTTIRTE